MDILLNAGEEVHLYRKCKQIPMCILLILAKKDQGKAFSQWANGQIVQKMSH